MDEYRTRRRLGGNLMVSLGAVAVAVAAFASPVSAQTLPAALSKAYLSHPAIAAERARLRATDESVPQALAGWRPSVTTTFDWGKRFTHTQPGPPTQETNPSGVNVALSQPVFRGFRTRAELDRAKANIKAGRQNLLVVEQQTLLDAATAYMDVLRDRQIVRLRRRNLSVLGEQLKASQARFDVGEITRTDVAQSRARRELARSNLADARASLSVSEANFVRATGMLPRRLKFPRLSRRLPKSLAHALKLAEKFNPEVLAAVHNGVAASRLVDVRRGELLPTLSLQVEYDKRNQPGVGTKFTESTTIRGVLSVPLYQGGAAYSRLREAKHLASQQRILVLDARRRVRAQVVQAWSLYHGATQLINATRSQVEANRLALRGLRQEANVGSRTTLDVLDGERELVDSQVALARAERDRIVRAYEVIAAVGRMTAARLKLAVAAYDPAENLLRVRHQAFGARVKPEHWKPED